MSGISLWWRAVRPFAFPVSVVPPLLGGIVAVVENPDMPFRLLHFILAGIGCMVAHAGANLLSDYYDYKARVDRKGTFGSSGLLVEETMRPEQIRRGAWIALFVAAGIGAYFVALTPNGLFLLWLIIIGGIFGVFYTAGPIEFKYRAFGDVAVFVSFGPAMVLGAYYVQAHHFSWSPVLYALPVGLLVDAILHSNNLRDIQNDKVVHIKTVPILIGERRAKIMYYGLVSGAYGLTLLLVALGQFPLFTLLTFLSLPLAMKVVRMVRRKDALPVEKFAMIDAATAQLHLAFGILMMVGLLVHVVIR
jgi:1,4-dihydroxy-2-naphthoate octaprenyltransferase